MSSKQVEFLVKLRDGAQMIADAANDFLETLGPKNDKATVLEETFTTLKYEPQEGSKLGTFEVAYRPNNIPDKFDQAYNILRNSNATIKDRYTGPGYSYSFWLYGEGKIYKKKLKPKT